MTISRSFDEALGLLVLEVNDEVSLSDLMNQVLAWFQDPRFSPTTPILVDFSRANWMSLYREYALVPDAVFDKIMQHKPTGPVAFVLRTATERVMMGVINKSRTWPMEWGYFGGRPEAQAWLMERVDVDARP